MGIYHKSLAGRFSTFPRATQIMMIGNELNRADSRKDKVDQRIMHLSLALELFDFALTDRNQWSGKFKELCRAREMVARLWAGVDSDINAVVRTLLKLSPATATLETRRR